MEPKAWDKKRREVFSKEYLSLSDTERLEQIEQEWYHLRRRYLALRDEPFKANRPMTGTWVSHYDPESQKYYTEKVEL